MHFHDLRHEGASRLFEMGLNIPHVAAVTGHRSWSSLKRYTHLRHVGDRRGGHGLTEWRRFRSKADCIP
ncbi:tyrosine-type recombinase/integrase [Burkholderia gladioli]|uniref:tyrosine-type recombinase/integrase n=1 Tax=Burkholderia gladioli TaxID=28095 RepID=UPI001FC86F4D|nr:tyrosine-type recombinase/integrase [Burkholderia gladioli]